MDFGGGEEGFDVGGDEAGAAGVVEDGGGGCDGVGEGGEEGDGLGADGDGCVGCHCEGSESVLVDHNFLGTLRSIRAWEHQSSPCSYVSPKEGKCSQRIHILRS